MIAEQLWPSLVIFQSPPHQESIRGNSMLQPGKGKNKNKMTRILTHWRKYLSSAQEINLSGLPMSANAI